jgi:hypothetical protein
MVLVTTALPAGAQLEVEAVEGAAAAEGLDEVLDGDDGCHVCSTWLDWCSVSLGSAGVAPHHPVGDHPG